MDYTAKQITRFNHLVSCILNGNGDFEMFERAVAELFDLDAAIYVINFKGRRPQYLHDSFPEGEAKAAVRRYIKATYQINPVYNALSEGVSEGVYLMSELAPDEWKSRNEAPADLREDGEEIGYRTPGWPAGLQELVLLVSLPDGSMAEASFSRSVTKGGVTGEHKERLLPFYPLLACALRYLWQQLSLGNTEQAIGGAGEVSSDIARPLEDFGRDRLSPREAEIIHLVLKGHSSQSISLNLGIALPTVKTHRRHAYAKLYISSQQELFQQFLHWQGVDR